MEIDLGRRRRRVVAPIKITLPKFFLCPKCGKKSVRIEMMKEKARALVQCGDCGLKEEFTIAPHSEPVDIYCKFTDHFYKGPA